MLPEAPPFEDRGQAGRQLAQLVGFLAGQEDLVVVGLAPSAMPVAAEVADALDAPLDALVVRPLVVPGPSEIAIGAVTSGGSSSIDEELLPSLHLAPWAPGFLAELESWEAARIESRLRDGRAAASLYDRAVVIVDDGLSSSDQLKAAVAEVKLQLPARLLVASPVLASEVADELRGLGAETDCLYEDEMERAGTAPFWYVHPACPSLLEARHLLEAERRRACPQWALAAPHTS